MITNRTRQKWQNWLGVLGLCGIVGTSRLFIEPEVPHWVPLGILLFLALSIAIGYGIFPRTISRSDRYRTSEIGLSIERVWFAVACGIGIWAALLVGVTAVIILIGIVLSPTGEPAGGHLSGPTKHVLQK